MTHIIYCSKQINTIVNLYVGNMLWEVLELWHIIKVDVLNEETFLNVYKS